MVVSRYQEYITQRMHQIIRRDTIIITHIAIVIVALLDIFRESEDTWPMSLKLVSLALLAVITIVGLVRLRNKSLINKRPVYSIVALTILFGLAILFLADFGSDYIYAMLVPIFLANFYYTRRAVIAIYVFLASVILLQPIVQNILYADVIEVNGSALLSWNSYALNLAAFVMMVFLSRLVVDMSEVSIEDKVAIQNAANEANTQKKRIEKILGLMNDAVLGLDKSGIVTFANDAAQQLLGNDNQRLSGKNIATLPLFIAANQTKTYIAAYIYSVNDHGQSTFDVVNGDGKDKITIEALVRTLRDDTQSVTGYIVTLRDVTEQMSQSQERHAYISLLSHELRTPLATLEALLSTITTRGDAMDAAALQQTSRIAHEQVLRLSRITNNLSDFVDAENPTSEPHRESVAMAPLLDSIVHEYTATARQKGLDLRFECKLDWDVTVMTDKDRAEKIIRILLDNAIKYTDKGMVTVRFDTGDDNAPCVKVIDTGIGISKHQQATLFTARRQGEHYETRARDGLGVGLYAAYRMAQAVSASLTVNSEMGNGSVFILQFMAIDAGE